MSIKKLAALLLTGALCLSALTGCGANSEDTIATLGEENVTFGVANFLTKYQKASIDDMYAAYGVTWSTDLYGNGTTMEENFKNSAMDLLHDLYTLRNHMADYNVEITAEDETAIANAAEAFLEANSQETLEEFGATQEIVKEVLTLYTIQAKMYNVIIADADTEVSDEEANMRGYSLVTINLKGGYDENYRYVEYTEDEVAKLRESADRMSELLLGKTLEDAAEELGFDVTTGTYAKDDATLNETLLSVMNELKEGDVSKMIETDTALYFVRIDADTDKAATENNRQSIITERQNELYEATLDAWQENDGWTVKTSVLDEIDFHNMFTKVAESTETVESTESE